MIIEACLIMLSNEHDLYTIASHFDKISIKLRSHTGSHTKLHFSHDILAESIFSTLQVFSYLKLFFSFFNPVLFVLFPSLSIWGLGSCRDSWIVVSSGQVVYSFQRVLGSEVKLSPVCCCLTDTPLQSKPFSFLTHYVLQVVHLKNK